MMKRVTCAAVLLAMALILRQAAFGGIVAGQSDTFLDGTTQGWEGGLPDPNPPVNVATGGPGGAGDRYLRITSRGGFGAGSKLVAFNDLQWTGNYLSARIASITAMLKNLGSTALNIRLRLEGAGGNFVSAQSVAVPVGGNWVSATFPLGPTDLTGGTNYNATLSNVTKLRIYHNTTTGWPPPAIVAMLGVDNITAVRAIVTLTSIASGNWTSAATWNDGTLTPSSDIRAVVGNHNVSLNANGAALSLSLNGSGGVAVGNGATLSVGEDVNVASGVLGLAAAGSVNVGRDYTVGASGRNAFDLGVAGNGQVAAGRNVSLAAGSTLGLSAVSILGSPGSWGDHSKTVITAAGLGGVVGTFTNTPAPGDYLGHGVLYEGVTYSAGAVSVDVFQASPGDAVNSSVHDPQGNPVPVPDRQINGDDIQQILAAAQFNSGQPANWSQGDFNDDGLCNGDDIQLILASGQFNAGPYAAFGAGLPVGAGLPTPPNSANVGWAPPTTGIGDHDDGHRWAEPTLRVTPEGLLIDTQGVTINGYVLNSAAGVFSGAAAANLGLFTEDDDHRLSGQMLYSLSGTHLIGDVVGNEWAGVDLANDLTMTYTIDGRAGVYQAHVVVPEPASLAMCGAGLVALLAYRWHRRGGRGIGRGRP